LDVEEAERLARELFGVVAQQGVTVTLDSYDDANFHMRAADGSELVLKVHNGVESANAAFIDAQNRAMELVRVSACWCPRALPSLSGRSIEFASLASSGGRAHAVRLLPFRRARLQADVEPTPALLREIGAMIGRVTESLARFDHPAATRAHAWDSAGFVTAVPPLLESLRGAAERELIGHVLARFRQDVEPRAPKLRVQIIHGDLNDQNVLLSEDCDGPARPVGVIDFGDCVRSWRVADGAIACAYLLIQLHYERTAARTAEQMSELCAALLSGVGNTCELREDEWAVLPTLVLARISTSLVFGAYSASLAPENAYLTLTRAPGWAALRLLLAIPREQLFGWLTRRTPIRIS